ncbi:Integrin beta-1-binding protein 2 [Kappamyces sp. JEL0829]|nr:Integrin beta-1-binding protein 2 [Kappamyces sp. JEL0829]
MTETKQQSCQNKGCGKYFTPDSLETCYFHPGGPVFHDALKGWSCCEKRVVDFDAFLKIAGCTVGKHSAVATQPVVAPKKVEPAPVAPAAADPAAADPAAADPSKPKAEVFQVSSTPVPEKPSVPKIPECELHDKPDAVIEMGTKCKRPSCGKPWVGEQSRDETCIYHAGSPVFHEGSKGWSCCPRKVLEFEEFLKIAGCKSGLHRFTSGQDGPVIVECRKDWYQTQDKVIISIFAKKVDKQNTQIQFHDSRLLVDVKFEDGSIFPFHTDLFQPIDPAASKFTIFGTKIEITLAKANGMSWAAIEPRSDITSWTTFGLTGTGGGTVGAKDALIAGDAPMHLLQK